jgi:hypothetical protein
VRVHAGAADLARACVSRIAGVINVRSSDPLQASDAPDIARRLRPVRSNSHLSLGSFDDEDDTSLRVINQKQIAQIEHGYLRSGQVLAARQG